MLEFGLIRDIIPAQSETWDNKIFLTFDIDWASDDVLALAIETVERYGASATWFVTHETPLLERLRCNPRFELGLHPNFNPLLLDGGHPSRWSSHDILADICRMVPGAKSTRSHSLTQSSKLTPQFLEFGITHDCNTYIPWQARFELRPWVDWSGLIKVPYFWSDDLFAMQGLPVEPTVLTSKPGLKVFGFHPIHLALNTVTLDVYEQTRSIHHQLDLLAKHKMNGLGAEEFLLGVLSAVKA